MRGLLQLTTWYRKAGAARRVADELGSGGNGYQAPGEGTPHNKIWGLVARPGSYPDRSTKQSKTVTGKLASAGRLARFFGEAVRRETALPVQR